MLDYIMRTFTKEELARLIISLFDNQLSDGKTHSQDALIKEMNTLKESGIIKFKYFTGKKGANQ